MLAHGQVIGIRKQPLYRASRRSERTIDSRLTARAYVVDAEGCEGRHIGGRTLSTPQNSVSRQELKDLIDGMHEDELPAIKRYLQFLRYLDDPVARSLADAPPDDEDIASEDIAAFRETDEDFRTGNVVTQEDLEREFGA